MRILTVLLAMLAALAVSPAAHAWGPRIVGFDTTLEARLPHNEGDFSRIGRVTGDVPCYNVENTLRFKWGRLTMSEGVNAVVGQGWSTVHGLGAGAVAMRSPDTWGRDLTPHWYNDARLVFQASPAWGLGLNARTSLGDNTVSDHFGILITRDWMK